MIGTTECTVISSTETEIQCRTKSKGEAGTEEVRVFLKLSETATCNDPVNTNCNFNWETPVVSLTTVSKTHNPSTGTYELTVSGSNFPSLTTDINFSIDGT